MIVIKSGPINYFWFGQAISYRKYPFNEFVHTQKKQTGLGFCMETRHTKLIDLTPEPEVLLKSFHKNTRYEVNRSIKDGAAFAVEGSLEKLIEFHNDFAERKGIDKLGDPIRKAMPYVIATKAEFAGITYVMHSYYIDPEGRRVRLNTSASKTVDIEDKKERALLGRLNRFLHYQSMVHFKNLGYEKYDFGGYALESRDPDMQSINKFKDSFKGELVEEYTYTPFPLYLAKRILNKG